MSRVIGPYEPCKDGAVKCPHCGILSDIETFYDEEEYGCDHCGEDFMVRVQFSVATVTWETGEEDEHLGTG